MLLADTEMATATEVQVGTLTLEELLQRKATGRGRTGLHFMLVGPMDDDGQAPLINFTESRIHGVVINTAWIVFEADDRMYRTNDIKSRNNLLLWFQDGGNQKLKKRSQKKGVGFEYFDGPEGVYIYPI